MRGADLAQGSWLSSLQCPSDRNLSHVLDGGENREMREWVQMGTSGKAALKWIVSSARISVLPLMWVETIRLVVLGREVDGVLVDQLVPCSRS